MGKILIVDDQIGIRILLNEVLQAEGYVIFEASNGTSAIEISKRENPDLILLDMKLPGMDGIQILKKIRENLSQAYIIMMTAYGELDLIREAVEHGANAHFTKPFDINEIRQKVNQQMEQRRLHLQSN